MNPNQPRAAAEVAPMKLKDEEILENFDFRESKAIESGEIMDCAGCGRRFAKAGTRAHNFTRKRHQAALFVTTIQLCDACFSRNLPEQA
jgi:hypothetical protein